MADPTTDLDALVAQLRDDHVCRVNEQGPPREWCGFDGAKWPCPITRLLDARDALRTLVAKARETVRVVQAQRDILLAQQKALLTARDALRTRLAQVEGERDRLLHEAGNCPDDCALDHEPRTVRGMSCPAGCSARMIPDYVETHLTMCPAVQTALRAVIATLTTQIGEAWLEYEIANNGRRADAAAYEAHRRVCGR